MYVIILNRAKDYYKNSKELLREKAKNKYRELSEEEKNIKREYGRNRYHSISEKKKQERLKEYQRNYREAKKHQLIVLSKKIHIVIKVHFKSAITKIFFISATDNDER